MTLPRVAPGVPPYSMQAEMEYRITSMRLEEALGACEMTSEQRERIRKALEHYVKAVSKCALELAFHVKQSERGPSP